MSEYGEKLASVEEALADIGAGKLLILVDDEDRENEGDLVIAAEYITPEAVNFMATHGRGLICLALSSDIVENLRLSPMVQSNKAPLGTAFTVSVDARDGIGSGLSAADRAHTIKVASSRGARPSDLISPGHMFPLRARDGGVLVRSGQTEGSVDMARMAGCTHAAVICEIMKEDGSMARLPDLLEFGAEHGIRVATVADLIEYRLQNENLVEEVTAADLPTTYGDFQIRLFRSVVDKLNHVVLQLGDIAGGGSTLVRVHRADLVDDTFGAFQPEGDSVLMQAMNRIRQEGQGVLLYLGHEDDRWEGMETPKSEGDTPPFRAFGIGAQILRSLELRRIRVLSSSPRTFRGLRGFGLEIESFESLSGS
ncbi:MAG: 3,4-dihydroxy-2-butanone-4-phosphate synthase [Myxococcales bacterium]|nr:3,4-dihydroxy-2-butanone-4-phosphate synthase [Myxococcales bacterium]